MTTADMHSFAEVADRLGVSLSHVKNLVRRGEFPLPVIQLGRVRRVPRVAVDELCAQRVLADSSIGSGVAFASSSTVPAGRVEEGAYGIAESTRPRGVGEVTRGRPEQPTAASAIPPIS